MQDQQRLGRLFDAALKQVDVSAMPSPSASGEPARDVQPQIPAARQMQAPAPAAWAAPAMQPLAQPAMQPIAPPAPQAVPQQVAAAYFPQTVVPAQPAAFAPATTQAFAPAGAPVAAAPVYYVAVPASAFAAVPVQAFAPGAVPGAPVDAPVQVIATAYAPSSPIHLEDAPRTKTVEAAPAHAPAPVRKPWKFVKPGEPEEEEEEKAEAKDGDHDFNEEFRVIMEEKLAKRRRARRRSLVFTLLFFTSTAAGATGWVASNQDRLQAFKDAMRDIKTAGDIKAMVAKYDAALAKIGTRAKQIDEATIAIGGNPKSVSAKDDLYFDKEMKDMMGPNGGPTLAERNGKFQQKFGAVKDKGLLAAAMGAGLQQDAAEGMKRHNSGERKTEIEFK